MADFDTAVVITLKNEGGYVDDPSDSGGATNMGITQRDLDRAFGPGTFPVKNLTIAQAESYYLTHFWNFLYNQILFQPLANKLFDMDVLFGTGEAVALLQQQIGSLTVDGHFGPATLTTINGASNPAALLAFFKAAVGRHIEVVVAAHPEDTRFEVGWEKRVNS